MTKNVNWQRTYLEVMKKDDNFHDKYNIKIAHLYHYKERCHRNAEKP